MKRSISVGIIGAGFGGIAMGVRLRKAGIEDFTILEAGSGVGGTWFVNRYPGASVDTPSHMYSFSFRRNDWSRRFAEQRELLDYLEATAAEYGLVERVVFDTTVASVQWREDAQQQRVVATDGREWDFDVVVSAVGALNIPFHPELEGRDEFAGTIVHTARWDPELDWTGKRVAVIGTGSSSAQVVPAMAPDSAQLTVFQRQPVWVDRKDDAIFTPTQRKRYSGRFGYALERARFYWAQERNWFGGRVTKPGSKVDQRAVERCSTHMREQVVDDGLLATLTPSGPYMAKRPVRSNEYLPALQRPDVTLVPRPVSRFSEHGVIDSAGVEHPADIVVTATGFRPAEYLYGLDVRGRGGADIHEVWGADPEAFLGVAVPGFPNFFMLLGPNSNYYAMVFNIERQADYIARVVRRMERTGSTTAEVKRRYFTRFNDWLSKRLARSSFAAGDSYFRSASGKVVTQWPEGAIVFWLLTKALAIPATAFSGVARPPVVGSRESGPESVPRTGVAAAG
jgi:cyclohexanone monooxygenase